MGGVSCDGVGCGFMRCGVRWGLCDKGSAELYVIVWSGTLRGMVCRWGLCDVMLDGWGLYRMEFR